MQDMIGATVQRLKRRCLISLKQVDLWQEEMEELVAAGNLQCLDQSLAQDVTEMSGFAACAYMLYVFMHSCLSESLVKDVSEMSAFATCAYMYACIFCWDQGLDQDMTECQILYLSFTN